MKRRDLLKTVERLNSITFQNYFDMLISIAISSFNFYGLPKTINERYMKLKLLSNGFVLFFEDEVIGYLCLGGTAGGKLNVYDIPTERVAVASNGYYRQLYEDDSVIVYNNLLHNVDYQTIKMYAQRLSKIQTVIDINLEAQKTPFILRCKESERLSILNLFLKYSGDAPFLSGYKDLDMDALQVVKTDAPYLIDKLYDYKTKIWNEALTYLGIVNVTIEKKAQLIKDEINNALGGALANRQSRLQSLQEGCREINEMFGLNVSVEFNGSMQNMLGGDIFERSNNDIENNLRTLQQQSTN